MARGSTIIIENQEPLTVKNGIEEFIVNVIKGIGFIAGLTLGIYIIQEIKK